MRISGTVARVSNWLPHEQCTVAFTYSGWIPCFMTTRVAEARRISGPCQPSARSAPHLARGAAANRVGAAHVVSQVEDDRHNYPEPVPPLDADRGGIEKNPHER